VRRQESALRPGEGETRVAHHEAADWIVLERASARSRPLMVLFNLSDVHRRVPVALAARERWTLRLSTDAVTYGGCGSAPSLLYGEEEATAGVMVPAWSASVYAREENR
jgi:hypothetical protein